MDRFWTKVDIGGPDDCWLWTASCQSSGYGQFNAGDNNIVLAHRFAYELEHGPVPDGHQVDHLCRVILCCNPAHLETVTQAVNLDRQWDAFHATGLCRNGHPRDELPPIVKKDGRIECRVCTRQRDRERYARRKVG